MNNYLKKYIGTYRVKADYDESTNDFPRDANGNIEDSFNDFYIDCYKNIKIVHVSGTSDLECYIPSLKSGKSIIRNILSDENSKIVKTDTQMNKYLSISNIIKTYEETDSEVLFTFHSNNIEYISKFVKIKTSGSSISPLSNKNLPKLNNIVSAKDMKLYTNVFKDCDIEPMRKAKIVREANTKIIKKLPKDYKVEMKQNLLDFKSYIYEKGLWEKYIDMLKKELKA
jgi:hypothetical protein